MSQVKKDEADDKGGLMYQQLRKFISVIVTTPLSSLLSVFRMNSETWDFSSTSSCQEYACWELNLQENHRCWNQSLDWTSSPEET